MKASLTEIRSAIRDILTESITVDQLPKKYKFLAPESAKTLMNAVWQIASDVAKAKGSADQKSVQDAAADIGMSMGAHTDDLLSHLVGQPKAAPKAPPKPSQSGQRQVMQQSQKPTGA